MAFIEVFSCLAPGPFRVIPAQAGIQCPALPDTRFRGDDGRIILNLVGGIDGATIKQILDADCGNDIV